MRHAVSVVVLAACGRVGFDEPARSDDACAVADAIPALASYGFDGADVTGGAIRDRLGNGRDGLIVKAPMPSRVPGVVGEALDFDAPGSRIRSRSAGRRASTRGMACSTTCGSSMGS